VLFNAANGVVARFAKCNGWRCIRDHVKHQPRIAASGESLWVDSIRDIVSIKD
jgi:hypothetical protein